MVRISIKVELPKDKFERRKWVETIVDAQRTHTVPGLKGLFEGTTHGWERKIDFGWTQIKTSNAIGVQVYPQGEGADVYSILNEGSPEHDIFPKRSGGMLRFQPGYIPSTTPGSLTSRKKYRFGEPVFARGVSHPGFTARKFTEKIRDNYETRFAAEMQAAFAEAARG